MATLQMANRLTQTNPQFPLGMLTQHLSFVKSAPKDKPYWIIQQGVSNLAMIAQVLPLARENDFWVVATGSGDIKPSIVRIDGVTFDEIYEADVLVQIGFDQNLGIGVVKQALRFVNTGSVNPISPMFEQMLCNKLAYSAIGYFNTDSIERDRWIKYIVNPTVSPMIVHRAPELAFVTNNDLVNSWKDRLLGVDPSFPLRAVPIKEFMDFHRYHNMHDEHDEVYFYYGLLDIRTMSLHSITYTNQEPLFLVDEELMYIDDEFKDPSEFEYSLGHQLLVVFAPSYGNKLSPLILLPELPEGVGTWNIDPEGSDDDMILVPMIEEVPNAVIAFYGDDEMDFNQSDKENIEDFCKDMAEAGNHTLGPVYELSFHIRQMQ